MGWLTAKKPGRHQPSQVIKSAPTVIGHVDRMYPQYHMIKQYGLPPITSHPHSSHEKNTRQIQLRDILQNNWPTGLKQSKSGGARKEWETYKVWRPGCSWNRRLICEKLGGGLTAMHQSWCLSSHGWITVIKDVATGEIQWGTLKDLLYYLCNSSIN